jgi:DNA polymerase III delta prime subunit
MTLVAHQKIYEELLAHFKSNAHEGSWLIEGKKHIGKYFLVDKLASNILAQGNDYKISSNELHPDFMLIKPLENKEIVIEQISKLHQFVKHSPSIANFKVVVINDSDLLNTHASNSLLKVLEEPNNTIFFLIAHNKELLPATILSRCRKIKLKNLTLEQAQTIALNINSNVDQEQLAQALLITDNAPLLAIRIIELQLLNSYEIFLSNISAGVIDFLAVTKLAEVFKNEDEIFALLINRFLLQAIKHHYNAANLLPQEQVAITKFSENINIEHLTALSAQIQTLFFEAKNSYLDHKQVLLVIFHHLFELKII